MSIAIIFKSVKFDADILKGFRFEGIGSIWKFPKRKASYPFNNMLELAARYYHIIRVQF